MHQSSHTFDIPVALYSSHHSIFKATEARWHNCEDNFYEVDILVDNADEEKFPDKNLDGIINMNQYTCYICNVNVPKSHSKEHNNSSKHKACKQIADIALERAKKQMQLDFFPTHKIEINDTHFCEHCSTVVLDSNKDKHSITKMHLISVKHDKLLSDLLNAYEDIANVVVETEVDELELLKIEIEEVSQVIEEEEPEVDELELLKIEIEDVSQVIEEDCIDNDSVMKAIKEELSALRQELLAAKELLDDLKAVRPQRDSFRKSIDKDNVDDTKIEVSQNLFKEQNNMPNNAKGRKIAKKLELVNKRDTLTKTKEMVRDVVFESNNIKKKAKISSKQKSKLIGKAAKVTNDPLQIKIETIMSKYFDKTCTVDALKNNNTAKENKNINMNK